MSNLRTKPMVNRGWAGGRWNIMGHYKGWVLLVTLEYLGLKKASISIFAPPVLRSKYRSFLQGGNLSVLQLSSILRWSNLWISSMWRKNWGTQGSETVHRHKNATWVCMYACMYMVSSSVTLRVLFACTFRFFTLCTWPRSPGIACLFFPPPHFYVPVQAIPMLSNLKQTCFAKSHL